MPEGATVDRESNIVSIDPSHKQADAIQAPYTLNSSKQKKFGFSWSLFNEVLFSILKTKLYPFLQNNLFPQASSIFKWN